MNTKFAFPALAALLLVGSAAAARDSADGDGRTSTVVKYADLDLSSQAGAHQMLSRIHHAAKEVCGPQPFDEIDRHYEFDPCVAKATKEAVARLGSPVVTAMYGGKGSKGTVALASR